MAELTRKEVLLILAAVPSTACRKPDHLVRLAGVDLGGLDLRGLNLAHADLAGADLRGCDLTDARLFEADLSSADLTDAILCGVYADGATFVDATLVRTDLRKSRRDLFYGTHLMGADFQGADLTDAKLGGAMLWGACFHDARLTRTDLVRARVDDRTSFARANLSDAVTRELEWTNGPTQDALMPLFPAPLSAKPKAAPTLMMGIPAHLRRKPQPEGGVVVLFGEMPQASQSSTAGSIAESEAA